VCRDRGGGYREGADKGAPRALQIADRWHLLENATAAFVEAVKRQMHHLRRAITSGDVDPDVLTAAEKLQWIGWQRRDEVNGMVRGLHGQGRSIKAIVRTTGVSRQTVRRILAGTRDAGRGFTLRCGCRTRDAHRGDRGRPRGEGYAQLEVSPGWGMARESTWIFIKY